MRRKRAKKRGQCCLLQDGDWLDLIFTIAHARLSAVYSNLQQEPEFGGWEIELRPWIRLPARSYFAKGNIMLVAGRRDEALSLLKQIEKSQSAFPLSSPLPEIRFPLPEELALQTGVHLTVPTTVKFVGLSPEG